MLIMIARCTSTWRWSSSLRATPRLAASSSLVGGRPRVIVSASAAASVRRAAALTERLAQSPERSSSSTAPCSRASAYVAKEAPALGSNLRATSTSATCAHESRSSRLTCPGREIRVATALTANEASARCSVTSASTSACDRAGRAAGACPREAECRRPCSCAGRFHNGRSVTGARAGLTPFFSAAPDRLGTALGTFPVQLEGELRRFGLSPSSDVPMAAATKDPQGAGTSGPARRRKGGGHVDYQHLSTLLWRGRQPLGPVPFNAGGEQDLALSGQAPRARRL